MKVRILLAMIFACTAMCGQQDNTKMPDYTPPPPEAAAITKFGDLQANEYNGLATYSLPLYTYEVGNLTLPITLNYAGAGVKVDDVPTWVGINWTLNAGGVITRSIRDLADEKAVTRAFINETDLEHFNNVQDADSGGYSQQLLSLISGSQIDNEPDSFQFSFGSYSGSFYFDDDWNAHVYKQESPLKIDIINVSSANLKAAFILRHEIRIVTPDGAAYYFGGPDATVETCRRYDTNNSPPKDTPRDVTAFYLTRIEHPINGNILLEYEAISDAQAEITISQKIQKLRRYESSSSNAYSSCTTHPSSYGSCPPVVLRCENTPSKSDYFSNTTVSTRTFGQKYLKRLYNQITHEEVIFHSRALDNVNFKRVLDKIEVVKNSMAFKTIDLEYLGFQSSQSPIGHQDVSKRFFLYKVIFDKDNPAAGTQSRRRNQVFMFGYEDPAGLPPRFSFAQDYLGHYNGKTGNIRALPDNNYFNPWNISGFFANRNPDFDMARKGTLTDIFYPTGGHTHFDYGAKQAKEKIYTQKFLYAYRNMQTVDPNFLSTSFLSDEVPGITPDGPENPITVTDEQIVEIFPRMVIHADDPDHLYDKITIKVYENNNIIATRTLNGDQPSGELGTNTFIEVVPAEPFLVTFSPNYNYRVVLEVFNSSSSGANPIEAFVTFKYSNGYQIVDDCGVLLKRITDFSTEDQPENIKRFYYSEVNKITPNVSELPFTQQQSPAKTESEFMAYLCDPNPCCGAYGASDVWVNFNWLLSDVIDYSNSLNVGLFPQVTISYGGDNFENGGVEKTFEYLTDYFGAHLTTFPALGSTNYSTVIQTQSPLEVYYPQARNGRILKERVFRKGSSTLEKIQETSYSYLDVLRHRTINLISKKLYDISFYASGANINNSTSNYYICHYLQESYDSQIASKTIVQYPDGMPSTETNDMAYRRVESSESYSYDSFVGQPSKIRKNTSDGDIIDTINYYVDSTDSLPGNPADELNSDQETAYWHLFDKNIVSTPIQTETWRDHQLLSRTRITYSEAWDTGGGETGTTPDNDTDLDIFPQYIKSAKGNADLQNKVEFLDYNGFGKPTLLKQPNGAQLMYQYNPRGQVVMKIENYNGLQPVEELIDQYDSTNSTPSGDFDCDMNAVYPGALVTRYQYDNLGRLTRIIDPRCQETIFKYNALNQLVETRDFEGHLIKSYDMNFTH